MITIKNYLEEIKKIHLQDLSEDLQEGYEIFNGIIKAKGIKIFSSDLSLKKAFENYLKELNGYLKFPQPDAIKTKKTTPHSKRAGVSPIKEIKIIWHEGTGEFDNTVTKSWNDFQNKLLKIYNHDKGSPGYTKVKVEISWVNGKQITDRIDVGNSGGDFNPSNEFIGDYLKKQDGVMYNSNFEVGQRGLVSWSDDNKSSQCRARSSSPLIAKKGTKLQNTKAQTVAVQTELVKEVRKRPLSLDLIKRYAAFHGKAVTATETIKLLKDIQKANFENKVSKDDSHAEILNHIQGQLIKLSKLADGVITVEIENVEKYKRLALSEKQKPSVKLAKKWVNLFGTSDKSSFRKLRNEIQKAFENGSVKRTDEYYDLLSNAKIELLKAEKTGKLEPETHSLNGFKGLGVWPIIAGYIAGRAVDKVVDKGMHEMKKEMKRPIGKASKKKSLKKA